MQELQTSSLSFCIALLSQHERPCGQMTSHSGKKEKAKCKGHVEERSWCGAVSEPPWFGLGRGGKAAVSPIKRLLQLCEQVVISSAVVCCLIIISPPSDFCRSNESCSASSALHLFSDLIWAHVFPSSLSSQRLAFSGLSSFKSEIPIFP